MDEAVEADSLSMLPGTIGAGDGSVMDGSRRSDALAHLGFRLTVIGEIDVPKIRLTHPVYEGVATDVLDHGLGHWPGSPLPGQPGNVVIVGHRIKRPAPFRSIDQLEPGDRVVCRTAKLTAAYEVVEHFLVDPHDLWIADPVARGILTIFACHPPHSTRQRYVVRGRLVSVERLEHVGTELD